MAPKKPNKIEVIAFIYNLDSGTPRFELHQPRSLASLAIPLESIRLTVASTVATGNTRNGPLKNFPRAIYFFNRGLVFFHETSNE